MRAVGVSLFVALTGCLAGSDSGAGGPDPRPSNSYLEGYWIGHCGNEEIRLEPNGLYFSPQFLGTYSLLDASEMALMAGGETVIVRYTALPDAIVLASPMVSCELHKNPARRQD